MLAYGALIWPTLTPREAVMEPSPQIEQTPIRRRDESWVRPRGVLKATCEDFLVEEVPLYEPSGEGSHVYLWVSKRDAAAGWAIGRLAKFLGVSKRDIGFAGNKDRRAVTKQWFSVPAHAIDEDALASLPGRINEQIEVVEVSRHNNKLRRGHLKGNRFELVVRLEEPLGEAQRVALDAAVEKIREEGMLNYYGGQRFGDHGQTLSLGVGILKGDAGALAKVKRDKFLKRLAVSAVQSELFNASLVRRLDAGTLSRALPGDVAGKVGSGSVFAIEDLEAEQARLDAGEIVLAGPMFGPKMKTGEGEAAELERALLSEAGVTIEDFAALGKLCQGTRRPYIVHVGELDWSASEDASALTFRFFLPSGSYATILLRELIEIVEPQKA